MNDREYRNLRVGDRVRTNQIIANGRTELPSGAEGEVIYKRSGVEVKFDHCEHCNVRPIVSRIPHHKLDLAAAYPSGGGS